MSQQPILEIRDICKTFSDNVKSVVASDHVSMQVYPGEVFGVVGESGCGKSTLAKLITHLFTIDSGEVFLEGKNITKVRGKQLRETYNDIQMVFQDAVGSFNPRRKIGASIREVLDNFNVGPKEGRDQHVIDLITSVGLKPDHADRFPHQLSGGECQRAAIAKAIAVHPKVLICDEATSALDVSVQAQIIDLLKKLGQELNMAFFFISHDLGLVSTFCERIAVMYRGRCVEMGKTADILNNPAHPYTDLLLSSVFPVRDYDKWVVPQVFENEEKPDHACAFYPRCPYGAQCQKTRAQLELQEVTPGHQAICLAHIQKHA